MDSRISSFYFSGLPEDLSSNLISSDMSEKLQKRISRLLIEIQNLRSYQRPTSQHEIAQRTYKKITSKISLIKQELTEIESLIKNEKSHTNVLSRISDFFSSSDSKTESFIENLKAEIYKENQLTFSNLLKIADKFTLKNPNYSLKLYRLAEKLYPENQFIFHKQIALLKREGRYIEVQKIYDKFPKNAPEHLLSISSMELLKKIEEMHRALQLQSTKIEPRLFDQILKIAEEVSREASEKNSIKSADVFLGKLHFLIDQSPEKLVHLIDFSKSLASTREQVENAFRGELDRKKNAIDSLVKKHQEIPIQNPLYIHVRATTEEIAFAILTSSGNLNLSIASELTQRLLENGPVPQPYEKDIHFILQNLQASPSLVKILETIEAPEDPLSQSAQLIRLALKLPETAIVTNYHARLVALTGILSHWRQLSLSSCAISSYLIGTLRERVELALIDFGTILKKNHLKHSHKGSEYIVPYLTKANHERFENPIKLFTDGTILSTVFFDRSKNTQSKLPLWHSPGLQTACQAIGIKNPEEKLKKATFKLIKNNRKSFSLKTILLDLIQEELPKAQQTPETLEKAIFIFETREQNSMLRIWENSLGSMSEGYKQSCINQSLLLAIESAINHCIPKIRTKARGYSETANPQLSKMTKRALNKALENLQYLFDPHLAVNQEVDGSYVLYEITGDAPNQWVAISTPDQFREVIIKSLDKEVTIMKKKDRTLTKQDREEIHFIIDACYHPEWLEEVMKSYHEENQWKLEIVKKYKSISNLPWRTSLGTDDQKLAVLHRKAQTDLTSTNILEHSPVQLCTRILKEMDTIRSTLSDEIAFPYVIGSTENHSFLFLPKHPSILEKWNSEISREQWLSENVIDPGLAISNTPYHQAGGDTLGELAVKKLISKEDQDLVSEMIEQMQKNALSEDLSIKEYCSHLLNLLDEKYRSSPEKTGRLDTRSTLAMELNRLLIQKALPEKLQSALTASAVIVADTNYFEELRDEYYCFVINPGIGKLEMMVIFDDRSLLIPQDQQDWIQKPLTCSSFSNFRSQPNSKR